jgi:hypothetical protein
MMASPDSRKLQEYLSNWTNGQDISTSLQYLGLIGTTLVLLISTVALLSFLTREPESAIPYKVNPPSQCSPDWTGQILDEPQIKVYAIVTRT